MPEYQHSCFISYKHPPDLGAADASRHFWMEFITSFQERLESFRRVNLAAYRDDQLQSMSGTRYPQELSGRLCRSVCLIAILVPEYLESSWCRAEWRAMEQLERRRTGEPGVTGFIIPILFRGDKAKADSFCNGRAYHDFRHIIKPSTELNSKDSRRKIESIAERVAELARYPPTDCSNFAIDVGEEVVVPSFDDPSPLT